MKKLITVALILVVGFLIPHVAFGYSVPGGSLQKPQYTIPQSITIQPQTNTGEPCGGNVVVIDASSNTGKALQINGALGSYDDPTNIVGSRYEVCFQFPDGPPEINTPISFPAHPPSDQTKGVAIIGLELISGPFINSAIIQIDYSWAPVTFENLVITNAPEGLRADNTQLMLIDSEISGSGNGPCIDLVNSNGSVIHDVEVSSCSIGIRMENANNTLIGAEDAQNYEQDKVLIHNNAVGIHLLSGDGNRWGYNDIHSNGLQPYGIEHAVVVDEGANNDVIAPRIVEFQSDQGSASFKCERDNDGSVVKRTIQFDNPPGDIILYSIDNNYSQPDRYIATCSIIEDGICDVTVLPTWIPIGDKECGVDENSDFRMTALYSDGRSSEFPSPFSPGEVASVISIGGELPASTMPQATDDSDITASDEEADILTSGASGEASGAGGGAAGMGMKCGGTLVPSATLNGPALLHSFVWMTLPLLPVVAVRRRRSK